MSSSTLYRVYRTRARQYAEMRNGWGTAPVIWSYLCVHYLNRQPHGALEAALRKIAEDVESRHQEGHYNFQYAIIARTALETPEQMHARVVTETADAIAKERGLTAETFDEHKA